MEYINQEIYNYGCFIGFWSDFFGEYIKCKYGYYCRCKEGLYVLQVVVKVVEVYYYRNLCYVEDNYNYGGDMFYYNISSFIFVFKYGFVKVFCKKCGV